MIVGIAWYVGVFGIWLPPCAFVAWACWYVAGRIDGGAATPPRDGEAYRRMEAEGEPCWCPCHKAYGAKCERGGCCYGPYLCNSELNRG